MFYTVFLYEFLFGVIGVRDMGSHQYTMKFEN